ncbi:MAG: Ig-like domain-containing protein [Muribaculaceae bacterium]|nr:Ig-like domain-containing protein [Muribaculaceae bacterium]
MEFVVRKWDTTDGKLLATNTYSKSANLESRGMCYNPVDKKVYGLFYLTDVALDINELDPEDIQEGYTTDAGYALCTIDLNTMELTQITPGIYYDNFVTLACSPKGKLYSMTAGGTMCEFDAQTGLIRTKTVIIDGEEEAVNYYETSGVKSQFKRQAACFDMKTGKMYWNGYVNNGMGYNEYGSYGPLSDKEWRTNGKYDTALYEVDTETGKATKIADIPNRMTFSALWIPQDDDVVVPTDTKVTLDVEAFNMNLNTKMLVQASVEPQEAAKAGYTWSSSDEEVATVDALGRITALKAGQVTITATANDGSGATGNCVINVVEAGDANGDGSISIEDANSVVNKILGK